MNLLDLAKGVNKVIPKIYKDTIQTGAKMIW